MNNLPIDSLPSKATLPRPFLRQLLIGEGHTEVQYLTAEMQRGYRSQCAKSLSCLLGVSPATIRCGWGRTLDFESMPQHNQLTLGYIDAAGIATQNTKKIINGTYSPKLLNVQEFLEYALGLDNLDINEMKRRLSKSSFFGECARTLSTVMGFEYPTIILWGSDMSFQRMPPDHGRILYYASEAMKASIGNQKFAKELVAA